LRQRSVSAEFPGVTGDGNGAELAEPLLDRGVGERCIDSPVQEIAISCGVS
jgi:hypothetical protein